MWATKWSFQSDMANVAMWFSMNCLSYSFQPFNKPFYGINCSLWFKKQTLCQYLNRRKPKNKRTKTWIPSIVNIIFEMFVYIYIPFQNVAVFLWLLSKLIHLTAQKVPVFVVSSQIKWVKKKMHNEVLCHLKVSHL